MNKKETNKLRFASLAAVMTALIFSFPEAITIIIIADTQFGATMLAY